MSLFGTESWLKSPLDRDVITRWTVGKGERRLHALELPAPAAPDRFRFLVVGDTGDSENSGSALSPQDAVAQEMAAEFHSQAPPALILHLGDVVYMTGERRLYDRNFRRPYAPFLTPESTAGDLVFRVPFLPVPGNHDYYDLRGWVRWLAGTPLLGPGLRALIRQIFAFGMPEGGSDMGRTYMEAFVDLESDTSRGPLKYSPGTLTKLPNRYYRFRYGSADFFALDSNTLDAPPPWRASSQSVRGRAALRIEELENRYRSLDAEMSGRQRQLEAWRKEEREKIAADWSRRGAIISSATAVAEALERMSDSLQVDGRASAPCASPASEIGVLAERWRRAAADLGSAPDPERALRVLETLEDACDDACEAMSGVESCLSATSEGSYRSGILAARVEADRALDRWSEAVSALPERLRDEIRELSENALDVQRELALERRRLRSRPEDFDSAQIEWLTESLDQSMRENPNGWRIVYLHHPLYSTIGNHCEQSDVRDLRSNLLEVLRGRVHLVLSGHSHAFEWIRSSALPGTAIVVSGAGGQVSLRSSVLEPHRFGRNRNRYDSMRKAGATEWCGAGKRPAGADGAPGYLYHYLRVEVSPDALRVRTVGVRRLREGPFRREAPVPVYHAEALGSERPALATRSLVELIARRDGVVEPRWSDTGG